VIEREQLSLEGRLAVVTGAAQGIGEAIALGLAAFGADLAVCDRKPEGLASTARAVEALGRRCVAVELDVREPAAVQDFVDGLPRERGPIDILVNNAAGTFYASFFDTSSKGQGMLIDENFLTVVNMVRSCVPVMRDGGSIINVSSIEAHRAAPGFGIYAAMKAAVESLTRTLALELASRRIRVNAIAPDAIPTPGDEPLQESVNPAGKEAYDRKVPLGWGTADDCAGAALYLASDLSRWVTGTTLHVDGGSNAARGWARRPDGTYEP
jgi:NAD(P)-dependent dehydrogenase (short-subunit alcohol dehydrogenase family)